MHESLFLKKKKKKNNNASDMNLPPRGVVKDVLYGTGKELKRVLGTIPELRKTEREGWKDVGRGLSDRVLRDANRFLIEPGLSATILETFRRMRTDVAPTVEDQLLTPLLHNKKHLHDRELLLIFRYLVLSEKGRKTARRELPLNDLTKRIIVSQNVTLPDLCGVLYGLSVLHVVSTDLQKAILLRAKELNSYNFSEVCTILHKQKNGEALQYLGSLLVRSSSAAVHLIAPRSILPLITVFRNYDSKRVVSCIAWRGSLLHFADVTEMNQILLQFALSRSSSVQDFWTTELLWCFLSRIRPYLSSMHRSDIAKLAWSISVFLTKDNAPLLEHQSTVLPAKHDLDWSPIDDLLWNSLSTDIAAENQLIPSQGEQQDGVAMKCSVPDFTRLQKTPKTKLSDERVWDDKILHRKALTPTAGDVRPFMQYIGRECVRAMTAHTDLTSSEVRRATYAAATLGNCEEEFKTIATSVRYTAMTDETLSRLAWCAVVYHDAATVQKAASAKLKETKFHFDSASRWVEVALHFKTKFNTVCTELRDVITKIAEAWGRREFRISRHEQIAGMIKGLPIILGDDLQHTNIVGELASHMHIARDRLPMLTTALYTARCTTRNFYQSIVHKLARYNRLVPYQDYLAVLHVLHRLAIVSPSQPAPTSSFIHSELAHLRNRYGVQEETLNMGVDMRLMKQRHARVVT
eukprot:TRINITY_DN27634_c0_g1_i1.p1 TRINITY_DN27634_c0_g1~~TRINITY_DN27634_c0_g1_i1.p1  ORF type:complete len:692 (+),score=130.60 TRINITY_DN27634_c0_g1_i1:1298-3373(+)